MSSVIEALNSWSRPWAGMMAAVLWQSTVLAIAIAGLCWLFRRSSPAVRYWLWQIVAIKLLLMPFWSAAIPWPEFGKTERAEMPTAEGTDGITSAAGSPFPLLAVPDGDKGEAEIGAPAAEPILPWLREIAWQTWLLLAWAVIILWQFMVILRQRYRLGRLLRTAQPAGPSLESSIQRISRQLELRRTPRVVVTGDGGSPFVCGLRRPVLVMPKSVLASLDPPQLRQVLFHELAHVKRLDLLWGWIPEIGRIIYFFHPVVYWVVYRIRLERELACDQIAMAASGSDAAGYAATLVQVVSQASRPAMLRAAAIGSAGFGGETPLTDKKALKENKP